MREVFGFSRPLLVDGGQAVARVPPGFEGADRFFATAYHASPCTVWTQGCFSKSCCASRLKASAATVLSRRGVVIPHGQREQHQPVKSSPSIQISSLFIHLPLRACLGLELGLRLAGIKQVTPIYRHPVISHGIRERPSAGSASLQPRPKDHLGGCPNAKLHNAVSGHTMEASPCLLATVLRPAFVAVSSITLLLTERGPAFWPGSLP